MHVLARFQTVPGGLVAHGVRVARSLCRDSLWMLFPQKRVSLALTQRQFECMKAEDERLIFKSKQKADMCSGKGLSIWHLFFDAEDLVTYIY